MNNKYLALLVLALGLLLNTGCAGASSGQNTADFNSGLNQFNNSLNSYNKQQAVRNNSMYTGFKAGNGLDFNH